MKRVILILLLSVAVCHAETFVVVFSGDSRMAMRPPDTLLSGDGWEVTELLPPIVPPEHLDEGNPGDWIHNSAWWILNSISYDYAQCYLGCAYADYEPTDPYFHIPSVGRGTRENLEKALRSCTQYHWSELGEGQFEARSSDEPPSSIRPNDRDSDLVHRRSVLPRSRQLRAGDVLHLVLMGTAARVQVNGGGEYPAYCCAWPEADPPEEQPACWMQGGPLLFPASTLPGEPGLREYINRIRGDGTIILYLLFADAAWWNGWLSQIPNLIVYNGAGYNHSAWIADDLNAQGLPLPENVFQLEGMDVDTFLIFESAIYVGAIYRGYFTGGGYACPIYDSNGDRRIRFYEALEMAINLNSQDDPDYWGPPALNFVVWEDYGDETPDTAGALIVDNFPNPFNPTTVLNLDLPEAGKVSVKIYDVLGREVEIIEEYLLAGAQRVHLDLSGKPSGLYFARVNAGDLTAIKKIALVK